MGSALAKASDKTNPSETERLLQVNEENYERLTRTDNKSYGSVKEKNVEGWTEFDEKPEKKKGKDGELTKTRPFKDLYYFAESYDYFLLIMGCITAVISGAGMPLSAIVFGQLSNTFITAQMGQTANQLSNSTTAPVGGPDFRSLANTSCIYYGALGCVVFASGYVQLVCWQLVCERQVNAIRRAFFKAVLRQNIAWFDVNASGSLTIKLSDNLERIKEAIGDKLGILLQSFVQFIVGLFIGFYYSWKLTLIMISISPLIGVCGVIVSKFIGDASRAEQENYAKAGAVAEEVLSCMRTVIAFNGQKNEIARYEKELEKGKVNGVKKALYSGAGLGVTNLLMFATYGIAFYIGSLLIVKGDVDRGTVFTVFFATMGGAFVIGRAGPQFSLIQAARGAATSMLDIIDRVPEIDCYSSAGRILPEVKGRIQLKNLHFNYETRKDVKVLDGVDLTIEPGETVALVGHSGCGKSTIMSLLLRFYDPSKGTISLDGDRIDILNLNWLRNTIGVVSQEPVLFDASIEDNIKMGRPDVTHAEMVRACKMANCHDFIRMLPQGYKSMVGERGAQMSGGQKQRIAIARALVRNPKILLLDEATSALDAESEGLVQAALDKAAHGRTTISIAHRLSTIKNCKKIVAMEKGKIQEMGTHKELMEKQGLYYNLVLAQQLNETTTAVAPGQDDDQDTPEKELKRRRSRKSATLHRVSSRRGSESAMSEEMSMLSDLSGQSQTQQRAMSRMMSTGDTERERMEQELKEEGGKEATFWDILKENEGQWFNLGVGIFCAIIQGIIMPVFSQFFSQLYSAFAMEGEAMLAQARLWALMFVLLGVVDGLEYFFGELCFGYVGENLTLKMRMKVFTNIMRQDAGYFDDPKRATGKICTRLATDAPNVKQAISFRIATVLSAAVSMFGGIAIGFYYGWQLTLLVLCIIPFVTFGMAMRMKFRERSATQDSVLLEEAGKVAVEAIENMRTVQSLTREREFFDNFTSHLEKPFKQAKREAQIQSIFYGFAIGVYFWMYAASFSFAAWLVDNGYMEPLNVFKVFFGVNYSTMMLAQATSYFPEYFKAKFAAGLIFKMVNEQPKIDSFSTTGLKPELTGNVTLKDVEFTYPTRPDIQVMRGLNIKVEKGKSLALVGPSGCGKSTVVSLVERFYDPMEGRVYMDEYDNKTINVGYLRNQIALVSQEPVLFDCSISENIGYGMEGVTQNDVEEASKLANIHNFITGLPEGYNTRVGEKGTQLSGGQKQRIAIARALVRNPKVLLLDEATSALDTESEKIVQEALDRARQGRTSIIIAHRLSTVQNADHIAVIRSGRVIEQGTHEELVKLGGAYFDLTSKQQLK